MKGTKVPFRCADVDDPVKRCENFTPSYDTHRLVVKTPWSYAGAMPPKWRRSIAKVVAEYLGVDPTDKTVTDTTWLRDLTEDGLEPSDINKILRAENLPEITGDVDALIRLGRVRDLLPRKEVTSSPEQAYRTKVERCRELASDAAAFQKAGCKREAHVRIPRGRLQFLQAGSYRPEDPQAWKEKDPYTLHEVTASTRKRWDEMLPPLDARTQSPNTNVVSQEAQLVVAIRDGLNTFINVERTERIRQAEDALRSAKNATEQRQAQRAKAEATTFGVSGFWLPDSPRKLILAGVPEVAAILLVLKLAGRWVAVKKEDVFDVHEAITRIFGGYPLRVGIRDREDAYFDLGTAGSSGTLRGFRGPARTSRIKNLVDYYRSKAHTGELPVESITVIRGNRAIGIPFNKGEAAFDVALEAAVQGPPSWLVRIVLGRAGAPREQIDLQHSVLAASAGTQRVPDYVELQGITLQELPRLLARQIVSPRKSRKGRQRSPYPSARSNPMPSYTLPADIKERMTPGSWLPYTLGSVVVPGNPEASSGKVVYWSTKPGAAPQVTSAARVAAWMNVAQRGQQISKLAKGEGAKPPIAALVETPPASLPQTLSNPARIPAMARRHTRRNPDTTSDFNEPFVAPWEKQYPVYSDKSLSTDMVLNRLSEYYYPGTAWDYYAEGSYGPSESSPVNRRNPRPPRTAKEKASRERASRVLTRAQAIAKASGCDFQAAVRAAWAEIKGQRAAANPLIYQGLDHGPYWPDIEYEQRIGAYGTDIIPPNRRNPASGAATIGRFPSACSVCGESMKGEQIVDTGERGPQGGKRMAHVRCAR